jgi:enoyl-CoA hydratase/carnithine racemase
MDPERVRIEVESGVATVSMVRGDKHNALDGAMFLSLDEATRQLTDEPSVRAVVLHGEGKSFCSGLDVMSLASGDGGISMDDLVRRDDGVANLAQRVAFDWSTVPAPVIAAIHGNCFGGGMQIALGADLRVAAPDAKLCVMEVKWGLIPDMGITRSLPRLVPIDVAKELTFSGRIVSGTEAKELGLVTRVADDPLAAALELAREIAGRSPDAVQRAKRLYEEAWTMDPAESLALETDLQVELIGSPNQMEAVRAGFAKETPNFTDRESVAPEVG